MLANIKNGIKSGMVDENNKLYIDDRIVNILPKMCWNPEIGRFMKGTYQWVFNRQEIRYFSNQFIDAVWVIDSRNLDLTKRSNENLPEELEKYNINENSQIISPVQYSDYAELGKSYNNQGRSGEAERIFIKLLEINPEDDDIYVSLGGIYRKQGDYMQAEKMFRRAVGVNPENEDGYISLGDFYRSLKNYPTAQKMYRKALELNPDNDTAVLCLGRLYGSQNRYREALIMFKKALKLNPQNKDAYNALQAYYKQQGKK